MTGNLAQDFRIAQVQGAAATTRWSPSCCRPRNNARGRFWPRRRCRRGACAAESRTSRERISAAAPRTVAVSIGRSPISWKAPTEPPDQSAVVSARADRMLQRTNHLAITRPMASRSKGQAAPDARNLARALAASGPHDSRLILTEGRESRTCQASFVALDTQASTIIETHDEGLLLQGPCSE